MVGTASFSTVASVAGASVHFKLRLGAASTYSMAVPNSPKTCFTASRSPSGFLRPIAGCARPRALPRNLRELLSRRRCERKATPPQPGTVLLRAGRSADASLVIGEAGGQYGAGEGGGKKLPLVTQSGRCHLPSGISSHQADPVAGVGPLRRLERTVWRPATDTIEVRSPTILMASASSTPTIPIRIARSVPFCDGNLVDTCSVAKGRGWPPGQAGEARAEWDLRVTMVGHATILVQSAGLNVLTDPVWSDRASPFRFAGPRRAVPPGIAFSDLPPIHVVLLSHCHYDRSHVMTFGACTPSIGQP